MQESKRPRWVLFTEAEVQFIIDNYANHNDEWIGNQLNRSKLVIRNKRQFMSLYRYCQIPKPRIKAGAGNKPEEIEALIHLIENTNPNSWCHQAAKIRLKQLF